MAHLGEGGGRRRELPKPTAQIMWRISKTGSISYLYLGWKDIICRALCLKRHVKSTSEHMKAGRFDIKIFMFEFS